MPKIIKVGNIESIENKVVTLNDSVTDTQYPSAKAVYDVLKNNEISTSSYDSGTCGDHATWKTVLEGEDSSGNDTYTLYIDGYGAISDNKKTWKNNKNNEPTITKIIIGDGITHIGKRNFKDMTDLQTVVFGANVTTMSYECFNGCSALTDVRLNYGLTEIGSNTFKNCGNLTSIKIPGTVKSIHNFAFIGCTALENIIIPDSVEFIEKNVFNDTAYYNNSANWKDDALYIGNHLIRYKGNAIDYKVKYGTKTIAGEAFRPENTENYNSYLETVAIPDSVVGIGEGAFRNCSAIEAIKLPFIGVSRNENRTKRAVFGYIFGYDGVESTDTSATLPNDSTQQFTESTYSYYYYIPSSLSNVTITDVTQIPYHAFYNCYYLTTVSLNNKLEIIDEDAFYGCNASDIRIEYIGSQQQWNSLNRTNNEFSNCDIIASEITKNKVTTLNESVTDEQYPSAKAVMDVIANHSTIITMPAGTTINPEDYSEGTIIFTYVE